MMFSAHNTKLAFKRPLFAVAIVAAITGFSVSSPLTAHAQLLTGVVAAKGAKGTTVAKSDPLAGDTWHASAPSWPGTIRFDGKAKKVVLEPLGSNVIEAEYTVSNVKTEGTTVTGNLRMVNTAGAVSESTFKIERAKTLILAFAGGQTVETYVRMTPAEAEAEKARLLKAIQEGKTRMPGAPSAQK